MAETEITLEQVNETVTKGVKSFNEKAEAVEKEVKATKEGLDTISKDIKSQKEEITEVKEQVKSVIDWKVTKDEADQKNQPAFDQLIMDVKEIKENRNKNTAKPVSLQSMIESALNEGDNYKNLEMLALDHKDRNKRFTIELKDPGDMTTGNVDGTRYGQVMAPGIIEPNKRKVHVRSLLPVGSAGPGNTYTFMREEGEGEGAIAPTAETGTKPQFDLDLKEATVKFEWIAGWLRVTRKAMNNIPGFLSYLNSRLPEKLLRAEDKQLLVGDGTSPNISGIMDSGNFTAADSDATILIEALIDSIAQLEDDEERNATAILLRPRAYYGFFKNKAEDSGVYDLPKNVTFVNGQLYISGVPVYASTAMSKDAAGSEQNKYIVGDFEMGAQLLIQNGMRIEFFEQDGTNVRENKITVRIEESVAFPIYGDNYFIVGNDPDAS